MAHLIPDLYRKSFGDRKMQQHAYLYLVTTGRVSGLPREIEIWFASVGSRYYLISERGEKAHWVKNILHHPTVSFRVGTKSFTGRGRIVHDKDESEICNTVRVLFDNKYGWNEGLIVELTPERINT